MSIKSAVRDGSFVKFLVGGVVLLVLTGGGVYFVKKAQPAETQEDGVTEVSQLTDGTGGAIVTVGSGNGGSNLGSSSSSSDQPETSTLLPSDESDMAESSGRILPRTGPTDAMPQVAVLGSLVYGATYFIANKRR